MHTESRRPPNHQNHMKAARKEKPVFEAYPVELRPVLTKHRLRRRRHRNAASVLTGAALALGISALRPVPASAAAPIHSASYNSTRPTPKIPNPPPHPIHRAPNTPNYPAPRHAAPESPNPSTPPTSAGSPATNEPRSTPSQPGRHAGAPDPPPSRTLSIHLASPTTSHTARPPPYPTPASTDRSPSAPSNNDRLTSGPSTIPSRRRLSANHPAHTVPDGPRQPSPRTVNRHPLRVPDMPTTATATVSRLQSRPTTLGQPSSAADNPC
jgi:hypothetical protein